MLRKKVLLALLGFSLLVVPVISANDVESLQEELAQAESSAADVQGKITWAINTKDRLNVELRDLEALLYSSANELSRLRGNLMHLEESIADLKERIAETEIEREQMEILAKERVRVLYKNSTMSYLEVLFNATSYSDFLRRFDLVKNLLESDLALLTKLQTMRSEQDTAKLQLENDLAEQQRLEQMELLQAEWLSVQQEEKESLIVNINGQQEAWEAALQELEAKSYELEADIRRLQEANRNISLGSGQYIWPLPGYYSITSTFGWRPDPFGGDSSNFHGGLDIAADTGTDILAVDAGIVIMSEYGYNGGYGYMVMIDHGDGIATLYAHCSELLVSTGQAVSQGEAVARVGNTGWSTGPHLHIEFRIDGTREDPANYLY